MRLRKHKAWLEGIQSRLSVPINLTWSRLVQQHTVRRHGNSVDLTISLVCGTEMDDSNDNNVLMPRRPNPSPMFTDR